MAGALLHTRQGVPSQKFHGVCCVVIQLVELRYGKLCSPGTTPVPQSCYCDGEAAALASTRYGRRIGLLVGSEGTAHHHSKDAAGVGPAVHTVVPDFAVRNGVVGKIEGSA